MLQFKNEEQQMKIKAFHVKSMDNFNCVCILTLQTQSKHSNPCIK